MENLFLEFLKVFVAVSIFFVWVPRYGNIKDEFERYNYPKRLRDIVGILKLSFALMLLFNDSDMVLLGSAGIVVLMLGAFLTHIKVKNEFRSMMPSLFQIIMNSYIFYSTY